MDLSGNITMDEWLEYIKSKGAEDGAKAVQLFENAMKERMQEAAAAPAEAPAGDA